MKIIYILLLTLIINGGNLIAQDEISFVPAELIPHEEGYYISGVYVDEDEDGNLEFHNGCEDYYEDDVSDGIYDPHINHEETGEQQKFNYYNCMIMPDCEHKGTPIEPPVELGYIQMSACQYSNTDTAILSYIQCPPVSNLVSIYMETSSDVSINDSRQIPYSIEYSKDFGETWEADFIRDNVETQGGYRITYDAGYSSQMEKIINASKVSPIVIRIITNDRAVEKPYQGQFVKLHTLTITADKASAIKDIQENDLKIKVLNHTIISENESIEVYNLMGQSVGKGRNIQIEQAGIYLVKSTGNLTQKIVIN